VPEVHNSKHDAAALEAEVDVSKLGVAGRIKYEASKLTKKAYTAATYGTTVDVHEVRRWGGGRAAGRLRAPCLSLACGASETPRVCMCMCMCMCVG
jgi:hypothetical protein